MALRRTMAWQNYEQYLQDCQCEELLQKSLPRTCYHLSTMVSSE